MSLTPLPPFPEIPPGGSKHLELSRRTKDALENLHADVPVAIDNATKDWVAGEGWTYVGVWNAGTEYQPRRAVDYDGVVYVSTTATTGDLPSAGGPWVALPTVADPTKQPLGTVDVRTFGAVGDYNGTTGTDSTAAIQAAIDSVTSDGGTVVVPALGGRRYLISGTLTVPATVNFQMDPRAELCYAGTGTAILFNGTTYSESRVRLSRVINGDHWSTGGGDATSVGVVFRNTRHSQFYVMRCVGFATGVRSEGLSGGNVDNDHYVTVDDCKVAVDVATVSGAGGWTNQNQFYGAARLGAAYDGLAGTRLLVCRGEGNTFLGFNVEGGIAELTADISGNRNVFVNCRWEEVGAASVLITGSFNEFIGGHNNFGPLPPSGWYNPWDDQGSANIFLGSATTGLPGLRTGGTSTVDDRRNVAVGDGAAAATGGIGPVAVGFGAKANTAASGAPVAVGRDAIASGSAATAVGHTALGSGASAAAFGVDARATELDTIAFGAATRATATGATAVGRSAQATVDGVVAVGYLASGSGFRAVAIGRSAVASEGSSVAVGTAANAAHALAVALGASTATSAASQVQVGPRHFELAEITAPTAPAADRARLFAVDNGSGKTQLAVRFASGATQVLATEP